MKRVVAHYEGEEINVLFTGTSMSNDRGIPGGGSFNTIEDIEIGSLKILDHEVDPKALPEKLSSQIFNLSEDLSWNE